MNLRILKKLSKRAQPVLIQAGLLTESQAFTSEKGEGDIAIHGHDRKHWERWHTSRPSAFPGTIHRPCRRGGFIALEEPSCPLKGTLMDGSMSGYYEPEWSEAPLWAQLRDWVACQCTDWSQDGPSLTVALRTPSQVLAKAREIIQEQSK